MRKVLYILGQLGDEDVEWLIANGQRVQTPMGTVLIHEGQPIDAIYIVLDGLLTVSIVGLRGANLTWLGAGEIVGEMSFVDSRLPSASVRAVRDSVVLSVSRAQLAAKLEADTAFAARFYRAVAIFLSDRLRNTSRQVRSNPAAEAEEDDSIPREMEASVLDNLHLAGARFQHILDRLSAPARV